MPNKIQQARPIPTLRGYYAKRGRYSATATTEELLQTIPLAGFRHHDAPKLWNALKRGQALTLRRERLNPHDDKAVAIDWVDHQLGYLPREQNQLAADLLDRDEPLIARIIAKRDSVSSRKQLELGLYRMRPARGA
ncbi:HIRAN domain-containing protein [Thioalkalivibrio thiocyanoxidans]|uniref:HIRAN domain-containing protein n=1 Tax=Thioalkalivibrio thiocyanoxidans TaxID=152475 RepID=UPI00035F7461|nr:HIRAN domain-containing protein [Thioalkalivibrio thiocyanoxidans]